MKNKVKLFKCIDGLKRQCEWALFSFLKSFTFSFIIQMGGGKGDRPEGQGTDVGSEPGKRAVKSWAEGIGCSAALGLPGTLGQMRACLGPPGTLLRGSSFREACGAQFSLSGSFL